MNTRMIIKQHKANLITMDQIHRIANYGNIKNSIWILLLTVLIFSSDALAKREGPTDIGFEVRFLRTLALAIPVHLIGIFATKLISPRFYQIKRFRFIKYFVVSSIICSLVTATDNWNDESWNPGAGVFVYLAFSFSFIAFRICTQKGLILGITAALAAFLILIFPLYFSGMFVQEMLMNAGINLAW